MLWSHTRVHQGSTITSTPRYTQNSTRTNSDSRCSHTGAAFLADSALSSAARITAGSRSGKSCGCPDIKLPRLTVAERFAVVSSPLHHPGLLLHQNQIHAHTGSHSSKHQPKNDSVFRHAPRPPCARAQFTHQLDVPHDRADDHYHAKSYQRHP